jgi:hypothetical protein
MMGRIYAIEEDTGRRFLAHIECDYCDASIIPGPYMSGWKKWGTFRHFGDGTDNEEFYCCPDCTGNIPENAIETSEDFQRMLAMDYPHLSRFRKRKEEG